MRRISAVQSQQRCVTASEDFQRKDQKTQQSIINQKKKGSSDCLTAASCISAITAEPHLLLRHFTTLCYFGLSHFLTGVGHCLAFRIVACCRRRRRRRKDANGCLPAAWHTSNDCPGMHSIRISHTANQLACRVCSWLRCPNVLPRTSMPLFAAASCIRFSQPLLLMRSGVLAATLRQPLYRIECRRRSSS